MKRLFFSPKIIVDHSFLLIRYRTMMLVIGILYPLWREVVNLLTFTQDESTGDRGLISIVFLVFGLLTYRSNYVKRNVSIYYKIIIYLWFLQVCYLMFIHDFAVDYLILGIVVIFSSGSSFLDIDDMLYYYLFCILLTGGILLYRLDLESLSFFTGIIVAISVSYAGLRSLMTLFFELESAKKTIEKKNDEFIALSTAVQSLFLPIRDSFDTPKWSLAGFYRAVDGCGGDWWSYSENNSKLTLVLGDVTGHGPGSAMMTASIASYMHAVENESPHLSVSETLKSINLYLIQLQKEHKTEEFLMTLAAIQIDLKNKVLSSWSAGCPFGFLLRGQNNFQVIGSRGSPLGIAQSLQLGYDEYQIQSGDRLFLFTDGIVEAKMGNRQIGEKKILQIVESTLKLTPKEAISAIQKTIDRLSPEAQEDDYTFVILDIK